MFCAAADKVKSPLAANVVNAPELAVPEPIASGADQSMYAGSISVPCHVPVVIVPTVVIFVLPVLLEISSVVANVPVTAGNVKFVVPVEVIKLTLLAPVKVTSALVVKSPAILNE